MAFNFKKYLNIKFFCEPAHIYSYKYCFEKECELHEFLRPGILSDAKINQCALFISVFYDRFCFVKEITFLTAIFILNNHIWFILYIHVYILFMSMLHNNIRYVEIRHDIQICCNHVTQCHEGRKRRV